MTTSKLMDTLRRVIHLNDDDAQVVIHDGALIRDRRTNQSMEQLLCQLCGQDLTNDDIQTRHIHYTHHPDIVANVSVRQPSVSTKKHPVAGPSESMGKGSSQRGAANRALKKDLNVFWHRSQEGPPPPNYTPGLIPILRKALLLSHSKSTTTRAVLCYDGAVHVAVQKTDRTWGCGYRNFLMACTALYDQQVQPDYFPALDSPIPPGVANLQYWMENAWAEGFDLDGAKQLHHKIVGTTKWIGTADLYVAFTSRRIPARLVDFPDIGNGASVVTRWIEHYFASPSNNSSPSSSRTATPLNSSSKILSKPSSMNATFNDALRGACPVTCSERMPIILQHDGHSRTVVGFEKCKDGSVNLLAFDPSRPVKDGIRNAALGLAQTNSAIPPRRKLTEKTSRLWDRVIPRRGKSASTSPLSKPSGSSSSSGKKPRVVVDLTESESLREKPIGGWEVPAGKSEGEPIVVDDESEETETGADDVGGDGDIEEVQPGQKRKLRDCLQSVSSAGALSDFELLTYLNSCRLRPSALGRKNQYQILYFPLDNILSDGERSARKVVTAEVI